MDLGVHPDRLKTGVRVDLVQPRRDRLELVDRVGAQLAGGQLRAAARQAYARRTLAAHDGKRSATARTLGITREGLYKKMKRLGIQ